MAMSDALQMSRYFALSCGLLASLAIGRAEAQEAPGVTGTETGAERYELRWVRGGGAESCVSGAALARLLPQILASEPSPGTTERVLLDGIAEPAAAPLRYRVHISVRDPKTNELLGERELTSAEEKCSALTPAVLLVLAMSVDPNAARDGLPTAVANELERAHEEDVDVYPKAAPTEPSAQGTAVVAALPASSPTATEQARTDSVAAAATGSVRARRPALRAALAASTQVQPELSPGVLVGGRVPWSRNWSASISLLGWLPSSVAVAESPYVLDNAVDFHAVQLALGVCRRLLGTNALELDGCGGGGFGVRWLAATALANKGNPYRAFFGPELGVSGSWLLGSGWSIDGGIQALVSLRGDSFEYTDHFETQHTLFAPSRVLGFAYLGMGREL
jgi:hypothetical protein